MMLATPAQAAANSPATAHAQSEEAPGMSADAPGAELARVTVAAQPGPQDLTQPQTPSNADFSGNGANVHGPYDSTRDGSPSGNGNGGGEAVGKPCAGCVGAADNKNPPGQLPGPEDLNNGYECDGNHGIGPSNPAHTGCTDAPPPPPPADCEDDDTCLVPVADCADDDTCPPPPPVGDCADDDTCLVPVADCADDDTCPPPPSVGCEDNCTPPPPGGVDAVHRNVSHAIKVVEGAEKPEIVAGGLPHTGASSEGVLVVLGLSMLLAGAAVTSTTLRRRG